MELHSRTHIYLLYTVKEKMNLLYPKKNSILQIVTSLSLTSSNFFHYFVVNSSSLVYIHIYAYSPEIDCGLIPSKMSGDDNPSFAPPPLKLVETDLDVFAHEDAADTDDEEEEEEEEEAKVTPMFIQTIATTTAMPINTPMTIPTTAPLLRDELVPAPEEDEVDESVLGLTVGIRV